MITKKMMVDYLDNMKKNAFLVAIGTALGVGLIIVSAAYPDTQSFAGYIAVLLIGVLVVGATGLVKQSALMEKAQRSNRQAYDYIQMQESRYRRKLISSINVCTILGMFLGWSLINMLHFTNMSFGKAAAVSNLWLISIGIFLVVKNSICLYFCSRTMDPAYRRKLHKGIRRLAAVTFLYCLLIEVVCYVTENRIAKWNIWITGALLYVLAVAFRGMMSMDTWRLAPYISMIPAVPHRRLDIEYEEASGVYSIQMEEGRDFHILQLTDIHLGGSVFSARKDQRALEAVYDLIRYTKPDLIIVTGDFVFPLGIQSFSFNNYVPILLFASFMRNIGIPWAFTYGNHDTEFVASHTVEELSMLFESFSYQNTFSLLYSEQQPRISGRSNQLIQILNPDGTINQALYLLDSNSYVSNRLNDYDYIHEDQVEWYAQSVSELSAKEGKTVPSLMFFHMPIREYREAYELYKAGSDQVTYYYGSVGERKEAICCSEYPCNLFQKVQGLQSTKGIFVGHDHFNNISLEYQGVRLTYGMSIDYLAMPGIFRKTDQRGGTLITLHQDSSFTVEPIRLTEIEA